MSQRNEWADPESELSAHTPEPDFDSDRLSAEAAEECLRTFRDEDASIPSEFWDGGGWDGRSEVESKSTVTRNEHCDVTAS